MLGFIHHRLRALCWTCFYRILGRFAFVHLGKGSRFEGWIDIPQRGGRIVIGRNVYVCRFVEFSVPRNGELIIGDGVFIGRGTVISAHKKVEIGMGSMLGEFVSIHDNDHNFDSPDLPLGEQGFVTEPLEIGANCWIGAKAVLVRSSGMEERCVLGAGAVLTKRMPAGTMAVGVAASIREKRSPRLDALRGS